jgi:hypothetical protein
MIPFIEMCVAAGLTIEQALDSYERVQRVGRSQRAAKLRVQTRRFMFRHRVAA